MSRHSDDFLFENFFEFAFARRRRSRHSRKHFVSFKKRLHRDRCSLAGLRRNFDSFLGFNRLMNSVLPFSPFGNSTGKFIHDRYLAIANNVLFVQMKIAADFDRVFDQGLDLVKGSLADGFDFGQLTNPVQSRSLQIHFSRLRVVTEIDVFRKLIRMPGRPAILRMLDRLLLGIHQTNNQRRSRLVNQNTIGFVDQHKI